jgi:hypothetical protein
MLNLTDNGQVVQAVAAGSTFRLPNGDTVSPAYAGWSSGSYALEAAPEAQEPTPDEALQESRQGMRLSFAQLMIGLVAEAWITEAEGEAWLAGTLPFAVLTVIDGLPPAQRFPAKARAIRPTMVLRADPLVASMGAASGKTDAEIDTFFLTYSQV